MSKTSNNSRTSSANNSNNNSYIAQLRRLKIQESILSGNVNKSYIEYREICEGNNKPHKNNVKTYIINLKNTYIEMRNLYEDIKIKTNMKETLDVTDINDLKRDVLELEEKIKSFKLLIRNELDSMQSQEVNILEKNKEPNNQAGAKRLGSHSLPKTQLKTYNEIVPSPVRLMINAPFKYSEIHQFQEFMKNSSNRYGGWNEYNHNLFVHIWNKYNGNEKFTTHINPVFQDFLNEALLKISGITPEELHLHCDWYSQFVELKNKQQNAIDKWKENKIKITKPFRGNRKELNANSPNKTETDKQIMMRTDPKKKNSKINDKLYHRSTFMLPTKQWLNRQDDCNEISIVQCDVDNILKLRTPCWRLSFKK